MKSLMIAFMLITMSTFAFASDNEGSFQFLGHGVSSCGKFIEAVNKGNNQQNWIDWNYYQAYVYGYFTGVNRYRPNTVNIKGNTDMEGVMAFIEKYCKENPLRDFFEGVNAVEIALYPNRTK